jgi:hypothetical protein
MMNTERTKLKIRKRPPSVTSAETDNSKVVNESSDDSSMVQKTEVEEKAIDAPEINKTEVEEMTIDVPEINKSETILPAFMEAKIKEAKSKGIEVTIKEFDNSKSNKAINEPEKAASKPVEETEVKKFEQIEADLETSGAKKQFGTRGSSPKLKNDAVSDIKTKPVKEIKSKQFFSEKHHESVEKHNLLVAAQTNTSSVQEVMTAEEFSEFVGSNFSSFKIVDKDTEYSRAASKSIIASSANTYYSVIALHSGYKANMLALHYLDKSRLNTVSEDMYNDRHRLFRLIYDKIENMSLPKPKFEDWLKMTALSDLPPLLYGIYAASYPSSQTFDISCNKCKGKSTVPTNPESIISVYDDEAYKQVSEILNNVKTIEELLQVAPLYEQRKLPIAEKRSVVVIKEPTLWDFLEMARFFKGREEEFKDYDVLLERALYVRYILIPDIALKKKTGENTMLKVSDLEIIIKFLASLEDDESTKLIDAASEELNSKFDVRFEIPKFNCKHTHTAEDGSSQLCKNEIGPIPLDMEQLLFFRIRRGLQMKEES